jgi:DNA polymerase I
MTPATTTPPSPLPCWVLIDGTGLLHRACHAFHTTGPEGQDTSVLTGTLHFIHEYLKVLEPDHAIVVFDAPGGSFERQALYPDYKKQRPPRPEEITKQEPWVRQFLQASGIPVISTPGVEADDVLATIARNESKDKVIGIISADKDLGQLVGHNIRWFRPAAQSGVVRMTRQMIRDKFGVDATKIRDFLALQGDSVDNLPGIAGVGPKTAAKLLNYFGSIDEMYAALEPTETGKQRLTAAIDVKANRLWEPIQSSKDWMPTMVSLVSLRENVEISPTVYAPTHVVNDQTMEDMRQDYDLKSWAGYSLPWQQTRITNINKTKSNAPRL